MSDLDKEIEHLTQEGFPFRCIHSEGVNYVSPTSLYNYSIYLKRNSPGPEEAWDKFQDALEFLSLKSGGHVEEEHE